MLSYNAILYDWFRPIFVHISPNEASQYQNSFNILEDRAASRLIRQRNRFRPRFKTFFIHWF